MPSTLLLDVSAWDLVVDINGNIAVASEPYSLAQDAASAILTFRGEAWYDLAIGVQFNAILGKLPPLTLVKQSFVDAASSVPGVTTAQCFISGLDGRTLRGQIQINSATGETAAASF